MGCKTPFTFVREFEIPLSSITAPNGKKEGTIRAPQRLICKAKLLIQTLNASDGQHESGRKAEIKTKRCAHWPLETEHQPL